jgi:hypothetical protein
MATQADLGIVEEYLRSGDISPAADETWERLASKARGPVRTFNKGGLVTDQRLGCLYRHQSSLLGNGKRSIC